MTFQSALTAWLAFLSSLGFDAQAHMNPPATEAQIAAAEAEIGFAFPDDLRALYRFADGQRDSFDGARASPGTTFAPLFGGYDFSSLAEALRNYRVWKDIYDEAGQNFHAEYSQGIVTARAGDPVYPHYWRPGWFPFSVDGGGNSYAVDLSPPSGGTYGQVILIGPDEDERRVLAPSLSAFLARAAEQRPPIVEREGNWFHVDMEGS